MFYDTIKIERGDNMDYIEAHGVFVEVSEGTLYSAPANDTEPPTPDMDNFIEVTCVTASSALDGLNFLSRVNRLFDTSFVLDDFDGR
jgi:hypothetical protein